MTFTFADAATAAKVFKGYDSVNRKIFMSNCYFQSGLSFQQTFGSNVLREDSGTSKADFK